MPFHLFIIVLSYSSLGPNLLGTERLCYCSNKKLLHCTAQTNICLKCAVGLVHWLNTHVKVISYMDFPFLLYFSLYSKHSLINQVTLALNKYHILQIYTQCFLKYLYGVDI
jgi:hypothetical protein